MTEPFTHERLIIHEPEHLQKVRDFADRTHQRAELEEQLSRLVWNNVYTHLYKDWAEMSFYFVMRTVPEDTGGRDETYYMNGGLIYHGSLEDDRRPETFSVNLLPCNSWGIHT